MKKINTLFIVWGIVVVFLTGILTSMGFMFKEVNKDYEKLEKKLQTSAEKYTSDNFMFPEEGREIEVTLQELIKENYLDELKYNDKVCDGYVVVKTNLIVEYTPFIKCGSYKTDGYKK